MNIKEYTGRVKERVQKFGIKEWGIFLVIGICCLIIIVPSGQTEEENRGGNEETVTRTENTMAEQDYVECMEEKLEALLCNVEHVGRVQVMITVSSTGEKSVLKDGMSESEVISETDSAGGTRLSNSNATDSTTVFSEENGKNEPYLLSESYPEVIGVVVLAQGSGTGSVDYDILNAVQVLFNIPAHKIKIMKMK